MSMIIRRYYPQGFKGKTYSDEYIEELKAKGVAVDFVDTAKTEIIMTRKEQEIMYKQSCDMIMSNTRFVLDNLEFLYEYKVNWVNYGRKAKQNRKVYKRNVTE